ncbi:MAG: DMT family transporter [Anaerolineae bacterium]
MHDFTGELASLGTSVCFSFASVLFTMAGRQVGSQVVNRLRLLLATLMIFVLHMVLLGRALPQIDSTPAFWLALSGLVGLVIGDAFLMQAFVMVGPRLSMLMMATAPIWSIVLAFIFFGEVLQPQELIGTALTLAGLALVVTDGRGRPLLETGGTDKRTYVIGLLCGLGGALGQAGGSVLSKAGLVNDLSPISAALIRLSTAAVAMWIITIVIGQFGKTITTLRAHPRAVGQVGGASVLGPVLGVSLLLVGLQRAPVGIATTLSSLMPIFLIPISYVVFKEKTSRQAVIGTLIAIVGTVVLFT